MSDAEEKVGGDGPTDEQHRGDGPAPEPIDPRLSLTDHEWFEAGAPVPDDFVDPELENLDTGNPWAHGVILLMIAAFAVLLAFQYTLELRYFFGPREAIDLNEGADEPLFIGDAWRDDEGLLEIPSNRYARVNGIPERRSVSGEREFTSLVGSQLYVERTIEDDRPRILQNTPMPVDRDLESARLLFEGEGRVISFRDLPRRYERFIEFYSNGYRLHFCGFEPSEELRSYQFRVRRQAEGDLRDELGREPTEQEVRERAGPAAYCQEGYLLIAGEVPGDFWFYPALYVGFALIVGGAVFFVYRRLRPDH